MYFMKKSWVYLIIISILILSGIGYYFHSFLTLRITQELPPLDFISLPPSYTLEVFADDLGPQAVSIPGPNNGVRMLEHKDGVFYATLPGKGQVIALQDKDGDWKIEKRTVFISGLTKPHGLASEGDYVYIAAEDKVVRVKDTDHDGLADLETLQDLVELPAGSHWTRSVKIFEGQMYISIGSTCNVCDEENPWRAKVIKCNLDGSDCSVFASGLRNAVDLEFYNEEIWATDNGRDLLQADLPPDEVNILVEGKDYGWPICYGKQIHDLEYDQNVYIQDPCLDTEASVIDLQAHSAPIGLAFYEDDLLVAFHGSWNRNPPTGYKIVRINLETHEVKDFASGWLGADGSVRGRPADLLIINGSILVSDDVAGKIYRIFRE